MYDQDHDDVIGYITRTDVLLAERYTPEAPIGELKRSLLQVPETAKILPLLSV